MQYYYRAAVDKGIKEVENSFGLDILLSAQFELSVCHTKCRTCSESFVVKRDCSSNVDEKVSLYKDTHYFLSLLQKRLFNVRLLFSTLINYLILFYC